MMQKSIEDQPFQLNIGLTFTYQQIEVRINLPLFSTVVPAVIGTTVENKGKLILTEIFPSVQKHDI